MNIKSLLAILISIVGEVLVISLNLLLSPNLSTELHVLNICVSSLIWFLFSISFYIKWDRKQDENSGWIGKLTFSIWGFTVYSIIAFISMIAMNALPEEEPVDIKYQLVVHGILIVFLLVSRFMSTLSSSQISKVEKQKEELTSGLDQMRYASRKLRDAMQMCSETSSEVRDKINALNDSLRYIAPASTSEAKELEDDFIYNADAIISAFINYNMNEGIILNLIKKLEIIVSNRKNIYM